MKVLLGIPNGSGQIPAVMVQSLLALRKPCICASLIIERQRVDKCRNFFCQQVLQNDFDYLFMVDDDNPIPADTLEKFIEDDKDVVIAPILSRNPNKEGKHDLCAYYSREIDIKGEKLTMYDNITEFKEKGDLHQIDAGGTGCILIKRKVIEALAKEYEYIFEFGDITVNGQRRTTSEDVEFCERAKKLGFEIWLDERIKPIHLSNYNAVKWHTQ